MTTATAPIPRSPAGRASAPKRAAAPKRLSGPLPPVRVRRDPPTLEEAVFAAQGLSDDLEQQAEIAAGLMGVTADEARPFVAAARPKPHAAEGRLHGAAGAPRVVVLKRRIART
jgi:hypothetical protein